jgi:aspartyl protease family protein
MRYVLGFAAAALLLASQGTKVADLMARKNEAHAVTPAKVQTSRKAQTGPRTMTLSSDRAGHFLVDAEVDGRRMDFVVDSGASLVTLRESDAARIGINPKPTDYRASVSTANGTIRAAQVRISRIEIGDITVSDINALVLPDRALSQNLLGVSFLSRLRRYEVAQGRLLLEE